jgi:short-subunit dehydrogenase
MTGRLSDLRRTAFVSGASSGLGLAFTEMLLAEGVRVWGTSRDPARLAPVAAAHPGAFTAVALDLADPEGAVRAYREASTAAGGSIDLLVNNAGYGVFAEFAGVESSVWRSQLSGMLGTVLALSHEAYGSMRRQGGGCIVHVSSIAAEFPLPYMSGYNVAKAGLSALSESLIFESRGTAVRVVDFRPGDYRTEFNRAMQSDSKTEGTRRAWNALEAVFASSPAPDKAARDLRGAILADKSGVVRSGSFFQAQVAPLLARFFPASWVRWGTARYFGG